MATVTHELKVCSDCLFFIANGDLPSDENDAARVVKGVESFAPGYVAAGSSESDVEGSFSWRPCDCCGSKLGGDRHDAVVLGDDEPVGACPLDGGDAVPLGTLGSRTHFRCRSCGIDFSAEVG